MSGIDAHCHVFVVEGVGATRPGEAAAYVPPSVDLEDHAAHLAAMGCDRGVLVQPSAYGSDHRCLLASLRRRPDHLRGVACLPPSTPPQELAGMHAAGVRGTRLQDGYPGGVPIEALPEVAAMVEGLGWHIELWTDVRRHLGWLGEAIRSSPVPVVIDHMGNLPSDVGLDHPAMRLLLELLTDGAIWVTLSGVERLLPTENAADLGAARFSETWARHESAIDARVRAFVDARPDRLLWGSDWPHVGLELPAPSGPETRARLDRWVPDVAAREQILTDNPARRYDVD